MAKIASWVWIKEWHVVQAEIDNIEHPELIGLPSRKLSAALGSEWVHNKKRDWTYGNGNGVVCFEPVEKRDQAETVAYA